jgi:hypothetical protein
MQSFDWAEVSAREYDLRASQTPSKDSQLEDNEYPSLSRDPNQTCPDSGGPANRTRSRKKPTPRRVDTTNK